MSSTWFSKFTGTQTIPTPQDQTQEESTELSLAHQLAQAQAEIIALKAELETKEAIHNASRERFSATFFALPLPCFTINEIGHIMEWNNAAAAFFHRQPFEVIDKPISEILGQDVYRGLAQENIYQVFLGHQPDPVMVNLRLGTGQQRTIKWHISPVKDGSGRVVGAVNTLAVLPTSKSQINPEQQQIAA